MTADITLRGPGDILAVLPYQLGYQPRDSVVVVSLRGRQVGLVVRTDLPPENHVKRAVSALVGPLLRDGATSVFVVGYEDAVDASLPSLLAIVEQLERAGVDVVDVAVVRHGRRFSPICSDPCCPSEGVVLPDPADVPAVAEYVARGRSPLRLTCGRGEPRRAGPRPLRRRCGCRRDPFPAPRRRRRSAAAWEVLLSREVPEVARVGADAWAPVITPDLVADAGAGLADIAWRDGLVAWLAPGVLPSGLLDRHVVALLRSSLPTWAGMGFARWGSRRTPVAARSRVPRPRGPRGRERRGEAGASPATPELSAGRSPDDLPDEAAGRVYRDGARRLGERRRAVAGSAVERALPPDSWVPAGDGSSSASSTTGCVRRRDGGPAPCRERAGRQHGRAPVPESRNGRGSGGLAGREYDGRRS